MALLKKKLDYSHGIKRYISNITLVVTWFIRKEITYEMNKYFNVKYSLTQHLSYGPSMIAVYGLDFKEAGWSTY